MNIFPPSLVRDKSYARLAFWVFLVFSVFYISITRGHFVGTDEVAVYQTTRSLCEKGDLSVNPILNTFSGRNGLSYSQYSAGQSIVAWPLYILGKTFSSALTAIDRKDWIAVFAGPSIGQEPTRWGGDIEIFFVNLFNCFITALLCTVFLVFSLRFGASPRWALFSTVLLGCTSFIGPFSTGFLQHSSEALFLLCSFYFLFLDAQEPSWRSCLWAGMSAALMVLFRFPSAIALPWLVLYLMHSLWQKKSAGSTMIPFPRIVFPRLVSFVFPIVVGLILHFAVTYLKFETIWGKYNNEGFHTPIIKGLYAFLFSPGDSILLFSPLLLLLPWIYRNCWNEKKTEAVIILCLVGTYLVFYGTYTAWHGLWSSLGPRYLVPIVPILLLPFGRWIEHAGKKAWLIVTPLSLTGLWVQLVHVAVNFAFVYHFEKYPDYQPPYSFLFIPDVAPVVAHSKALLANDYRVDMWLINVYRNFDTGYLIGLAVPLLLLLVGCLFGLWKSLQAAEKHPANVRRS